MVRRKSQPCVLTIAGSDSGGGAGVQADARTIHALGGFACMAITALTAQNTRGVKSWRPEPPTLIAAQIGAVLEDLPVGAIKTGLLPGSAAVRAIADRLHEFGAIPLVVDPVIGSTSGTRFFDTSGVRALRDRLLPRATLVTPNWPEIEVLTGKRVKTFTEAEAAALALANTTGCAVLLKGGHAPGNRCRDCLATPSGEVFWCESARVKTPNTHGTGCVLSAAIATELAKLRRPRFEAAEAVALGVISTRALKRAVATAREFLQRSLRANRAAQWGGAGPAFPG